MSAGRSIFHSHTIWSNVCCVCQCQCLNTVKAIQNWPDLQDFLRTFAKSSPKAIICWPNVGLTNFAMLGQRWLTILGQRKYARRFYVGPNSMHQHHSGWQLRRLMSLHILPSFTYSLFLYLWSITASFHVIPSGHYASSVCCHTQCFCVRPLPCAYISYRRSLCYLPVRLGME